MVPGLVNPLGTLRVAWVQPDLPSMRMVEDALVVNSPGPELMELLPQVVRSPELVKGALTVEPPRVSELALVRVPGPLMVEELTRRVVVALEKSVLKLAVVLASDSVPGPPRVPAFWLRVV